MFSYTLDPEVQLKLVDKTLAEALFRTVDQNRDHLREWLPWVDQTKQLCDTEKFVEIAMRQFASNSGFQAALVAKGEVIGMIGFHGVDWSHRRTSLGYWMAAGWQGRGLMTKACRALVNHAFKDWKLNRVEIRCGTKNLKSRNIPERLGFKHEGTSRSYEKLATGFTDHEVYGILADEW